MSRTKVRHTALLWLGKSSTDCFLGVQDMACDTFIKIARQCRRHFVALQPSEQEPFIEEIVRNMGKITCDLTPQQVHTFYEACGYMVAAQGNQHQQERLLADLMSIPNAAWDEIIKQATSNPAILQDAETIKVIGNIMKTNVSACSSIGPYFYPQIGRIYHDMLEMYRATSTLISEAVARDGMKLAFLRRVSRFSNANGIGC
jgi:exportin-1